MALGQYGDGMNCFEWRNHAADYLDGSLIGPAKKAADQHLSSCTECNEHYEHYQKIIATISERPRATLPIEVQTSPLSAVLPKLDNSRLGKSRWQRLPWYVRTAVEATGIVLVILFVISAGPKLRALYDRRVEISLLEFAQIFDRDLANDDTHAPLARAIPDAGMEESEDLSSGDDMEDDEDSDQTASKPQASIAVGKAEIWRFILKTDSPRDYRPKIIAVLSKLDLPPNTPGMGGIEAPGGIQFDLTIPRDKVANLKSELEDIAPPTPAEMANSPTGGTFLWYKHKSKVKVPEGKTRVVIWLSQL